MAGQQIAHKNTKRKHKCNVHAYLTWDYIPLLQYSRGLKTYIQFAA